jgi:hypothetical protein
MTGSRYNAQNAGEGGEVAFLDPFLMKQYEMENLRSSGRNLTKSMTVPSHGLD